MQLIEIDTIINIDSNNSILYQRNYSANVKFQKETETLEVFVKFMIEMTPLSFNYYIKELLPEKFSSNLIKNQIQQKIIELHNSNIIDFEHSF